MDPSHEQRWEVGSHTVRRAAQPGRPSAADATSGPTPGTRSSGVYVPIELIESDESDFAELERRRQQAARSPDRAPGVYIPHHMMNARAAREGGAVKLARELRILPVSQRRAGFVGSGSTTDELKDHNYDGIQEYDNPIPGWWHMIWWGSIVFALCYVVVYHSPMVPSLHKRHASAESRALEVRFSELRQIPMGESKILQIMGQDAWLAQGEAIFKQKCTLCHGQQGEGLVGPNMTDEYYKNTTTLGGIVAVIQNGAANGAMPAQRNALNESEVALVAAYMASLRGKNLQSPREAEGVIIDPWPTLDADGNVVPSSEAP